MSKKQIIVVAVIMSFIAFALYASTQNMHRRLDDEEKLAELCRLPHEDVRAVCERGAK